MRLNIKICDNTIQILVMITVSVISQINFYIFMLFILYIFC